MATFDCTKEEFNAGVCQFIQAAGDKSNTQRGIANMHKGLVLLYLGMSDVTDAEVETAAIFLEVATNGAIARGWDLIVPESLHGADNIH